MMTCLLIRYLICQIFVLNGDWGFIHHFDAVMFLQTVQKIAPMFLTDVISTCNPDADPLFQISFKVIILFQRTNEIMLLRIPQNMSKRKMSLYAGSPLLSENLDPCFEFGFHAQYSFSSKTCLPSASLNGYCILSRCPQTWRGSLAYLTPQVPRRVYSVCVEAAQSTDPCVFSPLLPLPVQAHLPSQHPAPTAGQGQSLLSPHLPLSSLVSVSALPVLCWELTRCFDWGPSVWGRWEMRILNSSILKSTPEKTLCSECLWLTSPGLS